MATHRRAAMTNRPRRVWPIGLAAAGSACVALAVGSFLAVPAAAHSSSTTSTLKRAAPKPAPLSARRGASYGFLATTGSGVTFLRFAEKAGGALAGSEFVAYVSGSPPDLSVAYKVTGFSGSAAGAWLTLHFDGQTATVFGDLTGRSLVLEVPESGGGFQETVLAPATQAGYAGALAALQQRAMTDSQAVMAPVNPATVCAKACPVLPPVATGYNTAAVFAPGRAWGVAVFMGRPLEICFAVAVPTGDIAYQIGPASGPISLYRGGAPSSGCVPDLGTPTGAAKVFITASNTGKWLVRVDQATTAEAALLQQQAQGQHAADQDAQNIAAAEAQLSADVSTMTGYEGQLAGDLAAITQNFRTVQTTLARALSDVRSRPSSVCPDAAAVSGEEASLELDRGSFQSQVGPQLVATSTIDQHASALRSDWSALLRDRAATPSYVPSGGPPLQSDESAALAAASAAVSAYHRVLSADSQAIAVYLTLAKGYVAQADRLCTSSAG